MERIYPGYKFDDRCRITPGPDTPVVNFNEHKELLLSTDLSRLSELDWTKEGKCRFLDGSMELGLEKTALMSFPRSGNTLLRRFLEMTTGIVSGSDMNIEFVHEQAMMGLQGEGYVPDTNMVWIGKTHYPCNTPGQTPFSMGKNLVIVRNPIDVFPSFANLFNQGSHSLVPNEKYHIDFPVWWDEWVTTRVDAVAFFHKFILE